MMKNFLRKITLTDQQIEILNSFIGTGDFPNADIIFMGIEEGLDRKDIDSIINSRCAASNSNNFINGRDVKDGHFRTLWPIEENASYIPMVEFQARLMLFLNNPKGNWFENKNNDKVSYAEIKEYQRSNLYREDKKWKFKSALTELKPFPKRKLSEWPFTLIEKKQYDIAFSFNPNTKIDKFHTSLRERRANTIENTLLASKKAKIIIGVGDIISKTQFFEKIFNEASFVEVKLNNEKKNLCFQSTVNINGRIVNIFLSRFFGGGYNNLSLAELKVLCSKIDVVLHV